MPLLLETYFFTSVDITANPKYKRKEEPFQSCDVSLGGEVHLISETKIGVRLNITIETSDDLPYEIDLQMFGGFVLEDGDLRQDIDQGSAREAVQTYKESTLGILYSGAREFVAGVTARQPWGPFMLPAIYPREIDLPIRVAEEISELIKAAGPKEEPQVRPRTRSGKSAKAKRAK